MNPWAESPVTGRDSYAWLLARQGMPVFFGRLDENGDPDNNDRRFQRWPEYPPGLNGTYRPGDAVCGVTGLEFDVLDTDPRNGGLDSFDNLLDRVGWIDAYGEVYTSSSGRHLFIPALGLGSHNKILPGIDLKGGNPDGTGRGFVFLPGTVRPSKDENNEGELVPYRPAAPLLVNGDIRRFEPLARFLKSRIRESRAVSSATGRGRAEPDRLRQACLRAEAGEQRAALLRYVHELERKGYARGDILTLLRALTSEMPTFDSRQPWYPSRGINPDRELMTLFHRRGAVIPDAAPGELDGLADAALAKRIPSGLQSFSEIEFRISEWLWLRYLAFGDATIMDGDPGNGKSLVTLDIAARATTGRPMPECDKAYDRPINVLILAPEDRAEVILARLMAAGADMSRVFRPKLDLKDDKAYSGGEHLSFPNSIRKFRRWIRDYRIELVIVDPIVAFLSEDINSNNDASVRRALEPFVTVLGELHCSALLLRHLNKDKTKSAANRGGGSVAFGAVSRIQLFASALPSSYTGQASYGISQIKNNNLKKRPAETLMYSIDDSDIVADDEGNMVPRIEWHGIESISAETLARGERGTPGPEPEVQDVIIEVLRPMFEEQDTWPVKEAMAELAEAGVTANDRTIKKARDKLGIIPKNLHAEGHWVWTTKPEKFSVRPVRPQRGTR